MIEEGTFGGNTGVTFCRTLVDEWARAGVRHAVVSPGSRSTPLALALADDERIRVHVVIDERSASFTALGLALATRMPAVLLCTSGTAAAEYHAAVVEADQAGVPLIVCTADRPPELHGVGAPQTIEQDGLYGGAVRWACSPGAPDPAMRPAWRSLGARAFIEATGDRPGPVHLNLAFREPLLGIADPLPRGRAAGLPWHEVAEAPPPVITGDLVDELVKRLAGRRVVAVIGGGNPPGTADSLHALAEAANWPILADPLSGAYNTRPSTVAHWDSLLRQPHFVAMHRPEVLLRLGEPPASKALAQLVASVDAEQILLPGPARVADPSRRANLVVHEPAPAVLDALRGPLSSRRAEPGWRHQWVSAGAHASAAIAEVLSRHFEPTDPMVARGALHGLPEGADLVVSSSMPIRDLEWFGTPRDGVRVLANRGVNGIDGVVSTAVGVALAGRPTVALVGDLAFLHDSTALIGLTGRDVTLCIVVVNNDGGGIFSFLPQRTELSEDRFELLYGTPHGVDLQVLATAHGVRASAIVEGASVSRTLATALDQGGVRVFVCDTDRHTNVTVHELLDEAVAAALTEVETPS